METLTSLVSSYRLWLVRHGPVVGIPGGAIVGQLDVACDLSQTATLEWLRGCLPSDGGLVSSPLRRAVDTGQAVMGRAPDFQDRRLSEQDFGQWTGKLWSEIGPAAQDSDFWDDPALSCPPGGESFFHQCQRVGGWIMECPFAKGLTADGFVGDWVVACHAGTIRAALAFALARAQGEVFVGPEQARAALAFSIDPLSLTRIEFFTDGAAIRCVNAKAPG